MPVEDRYNLEFSIGWPAQGGLPGRIVSGILSVAILGALGLLGYAAASSKPGEAFTNFYILGRDGQVGGYPSQLILADGRLIQVEYGNSTVEEAGLAYLIIDIENHEQASAGYEIALEVNGSPVDIYVDGNDLDRVGPLLLSNNEKWEHEIGFASLAVGDHQRVDFILYKDGTPYFADPLRLWIDVKAQ